MITSGYQIYNPPSKETFSFLSTDAETNGDRFLMNVLIAPGGGVTGGAHQYHKHPLASETFTVMRNRLRVCILNQYDRILEPGQTFTVPKNTWHTYVVMHPTQEAEITVEMRPALDYARFFATLAAVAQEHPRFYKRDGSVNMAKALPIVSLFMHQFPDLTVLQRPSPNAQKVIFALFARLARLRGLKITMPDDSVARTAEDYAQRIRSAVPSPHTAGRWSENLPGLSAQKR